MKQIDNFVYSGAEFLNAGKCGKVYRGTNTENGESVAIKVVPLTNISSTPLTRLQIAREIENLKNLSKCKNMHLVELFTVKQTTNNLYYMMEYCDEGNLQSFLLAQRNLCVAEQEAREIFTDLIRAFKQLQQFNILHRNISPSVVLKRKGVWKLGGFKYSRTLDVNSKANSLVGVPLYMAPQIIDGSHNYTRKCDIWSLGILFYEVLYGVTPFSGTTFEELKRKVTAGTFEFPEEPAVSTDLKNLISKMLRVKEDERCDWDVIFMFDWENNPSTEVNMKGKDGLLTPRFAPKSEFNVSG